MHKIQNIMVFFECFVLFCSHNQHKKKPIDNQTKMNQLTDRIHFSTFGGKMFFDNLERTVIMSSDTKPMETAASREYGVN